MNKIHLGNYEEFFILYIDHELNEEQRKMVDEFLAANPDLKAEFEILLSTKLPLEDFNFDKKDLLAENMKLFSVDEELLLYVDNELPADKKKTVELEIASNKEYQLQHRLLLQTKLDPSEKIEYPNKKELYRRTEKVISIKVWMRVAAAAVVLAIAGILYLNNSSGPSTDHSRVAQTEKKSIQKTETSQPQIRDEHEIVPENNLPEQNLAAINSSSKKENSRSLKKVEPKQKKTEEQPLIALNETENSLEGSIPRDRISHVQFDGGKPNELSQPEVSLNKVDVTYSPLPRSKNEAAIDTKGLIASNDRKGSVKGFLRKATRLIEKRTGIDPTNDGELLIGAVAINLK